MDGGRAEKWRDLGRARILLSRTATEMTIADLERKAKTVRRREGPRRAALVYQRICDACPESASHRALLGAALLASGRTEEAADSLRTAVWLRMREGRAAKAASVARLLLRIADGDPTAERAIARAA